MGAIQKTLSIWKRSRMVGKDLTRLNQCPCCGGVEFEFLFPSNDLAAKLYVDRRLVRSDYSLCRRCGTIFSAVRPLPRAAELYYGLFPEIENRRYGIYPPPSGYLKGKAEAAASLVARLRESNTLKPGLSVFHVRCDAGSLLQALRDEIPDACLHGADYFDTNVRYARELGFNDVGVLSPAGVELPDQPTYDLIIANHVFTHAINPLADLRKISAALKPAGRVLIYNENDHELLFDPASEFFTRMDVISYHQQLFVRDSFEAFLRLAGFDCSFLDNHRFTFMYLAWPRTEPVTATGIAPEALAKERDLVRKWLPFADRNRYLMPLAKWMKSADRLPWLTKKLQKMTASPAKKKRAAKKKRPAAA